MRANADPYASTRGALYAASVEANNLSRTKRFFLEATIFDSTTSVWTPTLLSFEQGGSSRRGTKAATCQRRKLGASSTAVIWM